MMKRTLRALVPNLPSPTIAGAIACIIVVTAIVPALAAGAPPLAAQGPAQGSAQRAAKDENAKRVDALFAPWSATDSPGCAVAVVRDGRIIYARGYGMANLDLGVPNTSSTVFNIASMSKQFTAAGVVMLAQAGKLALDDDVRKYVPELPQYERPVTIRQLLQHTSGIRDFIDLMTLGGRPIDSVYTLDETLRLIARQRALNFAPGDRYLYSNSGYILLLAIVERVSGEKFGRFVEHNIFEPLGMTHSRVYDDRSMIVKDRATGYFKRPDGSLGGRMSAWQIPGDGGVLTTVEDLFLWDQNFYDKKLGGPERGADLIAQLTKPGTLHDGSPMEYGLGLRVETYRGLRLISHSGGIGGFGTQMLRFPDRRFTAISLCNTSEPNTTALTKSIADIYLFDNTPGPPAPPVPPTTAAAASRTLAPAELARYEGEYWSEDVDAALTVRARDGRLWIERRDAAPIPLSPQSEGDGAAPGSNEFKAARFTVAFMSGAQTTARPAAKTAAQASAPMTAFTISTTRANNIRFERRGAAAVSSSARTR
jgi:CubicO group peptidase (beta-lactamase class C family)